LVRHTLAYRKMAVATVCFVRHPCEVPVCLTSCKALAATFCGGAGGAVELDAWMD
jgi:hypothetical protein